MNTCIPNMTPEATAANNAGINAIATSATHPYIAAWGKLLGFTPATVENELRLAAQDNAPADAVQRIGGKWTTLADIRSEATRQQVIALAK